MTKQTKSFLSADYVKACRAVMKAAESNPNNRLLQYAYSYASRGLGMDGESRRVQCLYILNNLSTWKGEEAKASKEVFKFFANPNIFK